MSADVLVGRLRAVVEKAIAQNPKSRYQTVDEFIKAVDRAPGNETDPTVQQ